MGEFINHNSFLLSMLIMETLAAWYFLRRGATKRKLLALGAVSLVFALGFYSLRPGDRVSGTAAEIQARIGQGVPVLLEFKSPN